MYFCETGLICSLLGISDKNQLNLLPLRGSIFETFVVSELVKIRTNLGKEINLYYWRDKTGHEVDVIIVEGLALLQVEIKTGKTVQQEFFKNLLYWIKLSENKKRCYIIWCRPMAGTNQWHYNRRIDAPSGG